jgi:hypothetical protein
LASAVYSEVAITLQSGKEVTLRPLPIGPLRRFMDAWGKLIEADDDDDGLDVYINCAGIALESHFKGEFESLRANEAGRKKGEFLSEEYKTHLEDILDLDTIFKILEVCGGLKLNVDPKLMEEAAQVAEQVGKN